MAKPPATTTTKPVRAIDSFKAQLRAALPTVMRMLPAHVKPEEFEARVITAVANKPELLECTSDSLLKACAEAAELGLSLNPQLGEAWILKVWNSKIGKAEAQLRPGFIGLMKLARQSGEVRKIEAHVRCKNDYWKMVRGINPDLQHEPADGDRGEPVGVYCWWELTDGVKQFEYMTADDVERIKKRSSAKNKEGEVVGPWISDPEEMWRKTVVRRARKYMPQSPQMAKFHEAMAHDNDLEFDTDVPPVMDVTDVTPPASAGSAQVDKLADKLAPKPSRLEPPAGFDGPDYFAWMAAARPVVDGLPEPERAAWFKVHADIVKKAPPEVMEWAAS